jgi:hypothetical protein
MWFAYEGLPFWFAWKYSPNWHELIKEKRINLLLSSALL